MSLSKQFSLSLELTRLVPAGLAASNAIMDFARSLKNSGSDIVIEEDLATVFGRCRISPQMERNFRNVVARNKSSILNGAIGLSLEGGPGPTVLRGLTQTPYFAMVIQCSLLTFVHEKSSLAAAIAQVCERESEDSEPGKSIRAVPSHEALHAVLQACEDQTSSYGWSGLLLAAASTLDISEDDAYEAIPSVVLQGAVHMFPLVQSLPDDRMVLIHASEGAGACSLVVWAHHVLGLAVLVRKYGTRNELIEKQIGSGANHVIIDLRDRSLSWVGDQSILELKQPSITLLSVSENEPLLVLRSEPDEGTLDAVYKRPAAGFGTRILESECPREETRAALTRELTALIVAFAAIISPKLYARPRFAFSDNFLVQQSNKSQPSPNGLDIPPYQYGLQYAGSSCGCSEDAIIRSACFLFGLPRLSRKTFEGYIVAYSEIPFDTSLEIPIPCPCSWTNTL